MGQLRPYPGFVGPSYTSQSKIAAYDRTVNWYVESIESGTGTARYVLYPTPGFFSAVTGLDSPGRGAISDVHTVTGPSSTATAMFFVSGSTLYEYPSTVRASTIVDGTGAPVTMVWNGIQGHQLLIASDSTTYCYDTASHVLTAVGIGMSVDFLQGYGLSLNTGDSTFSFSALFDFSTWNALDVVQRQDAPDPWLRLIVYHKEVWLFGSQTTSVYGLSGDADTPFEAIPSVFIEMGIIAPNSACIVDGDLMWIGGNDAGQGVVYRANGYTPQRISTHAVEFAFQSGDVGVLSLAEGCTYQQNGHVFYELTLPSQAGSTTGSTWTYDATEGLWSERGAWNGLEFQEMDTRGYFDGFTLSRSTGTVYSVITDPASAVAWLGTDGEPIVRLRRAPHLLQAQQLTRYSQLRVLMETGVGLATGQGSDPTIALRWSDDGGQTWGSTITASVGPRGAYSTLVDFYMLGQGRDRIYEFTTADPIPYRLIDAYLGYSVGAF